MEFVNHRGAFSCDVYRLENLLHLVGIGVFKLSVFQRHGREGQGGSDNYHHHCDVDDGVDVALFIYHNQCCVMAI